MTIEKTQLESAAYGLAPSETEELARLRDFFENASIGLHLAGPDGTILDANRADYELLGYTADEYVGHNIAEFHADAEVIADILTRLAGGEVLRYYEARLRRKDGSIRHVLIDSSVNFVEGQFQNTRCFTRDITEQTETQRALRETQHRFSAFMGSLPGAAWLKDRTGRYVYANDEALRIFNTTRDGLYGHEDEEVFPAETAAQFRENDRLALSKGSGIQTIEVLEQADGVHYSIVSKFPVLGSSGQVEYVGGVAFDITERLKAEQALKEKSQQLEIITNSLPALISYIDKDGRYQFNNKAYEQWFGLATEGVRGKNVAEVLGQDAYDAIRPYIEQALRGESVEYESLVPYRNAGPRWVHAQYVPDKTPAGETRGFFALVTDISESKRLQERQEYLLDDARRANEALRAANQAKDEFLGMVSHELRTPLTTILGNSQLLTRTPDLLEPNERRDVSGDIYKESIRLTNIVENLLLMARFDHGHQVELEPVVLRRLAGRVIQDVGRVSQHVFDVHFPAEIITVAGNPTLIEQVIRNLVSNAEKYSPIGSLIELSILEESNMLVLNVADRGVGLNPNEAEHIFEPFFRSAMTASRSGVGIGLSVCKRLIGAMDGQIWAGPREGGGSVFSFSLPKYRGGPDLTEEAE